MEDRGFLGGLVPGVELDYWGGGEVAAGEGSEGKLFGDCCGGRGGRRDLWTCVSENGGLEGDGEEAYRSFLKREEVDGVPF